MKFLKDNEILGILFNLLNSDLIDFQKLGVLRVREFLNRKFKEDNYEIQFNDILFKELIKLLYVSSDRSILVI